MVMSMSSYIEMPHSYIQISFSYIDVSHYYIRKLKCSLAVIIRTCSFAVVIRPLLCYGRKECKVVSTLDLKEYIKCFVK